MVFFSGVSRGGAGWGVAGRAAAASSVLSLSKLLGLRVVVCKEGNSLSLVGWLILAPSVRAATDY